MNKTKFIQLISLVLFSFTSPVQASNWMQVTKSQDNEVTYSIDASSLVRNKSIVKGWILAEFSTPRAVDESKAEVTYTTEKSLNQWDCANRTNAFIQTAQYSAEGNAVDSWENKNITPRVVVPDSIGEASLNMACLISDPTQKKTKPHKK